MYNTSERGYTLRELIRRDQAEILLRILQYENRFAGYGPRVTDCGGANTDLRRTKMEDEAANGEEPSLPEPDYNLATPIRDC
jgi:hypothetical protein